MHNCPAVSVQSVVLGFLFKKLANAKTRRFPAAPIDVALSAHSHGRDGLVSPFFTRCIFPGFMPVYLRTGSINVSLYLKDNTQIAR